MLFAQERAIQLIHVEPRATAPTLTRLMLNAAIAYSKRNQYPADGVAIKGVRNEMVAGGIDVSGFSSVAKILSVRIRGIILLILIINLIIIG